MDDNYKSKLHQNVILFRGSASFVSDKVIEVNSEHLTASKIIISTGTRPKKSPYENAWTSDDIFPLQKIPNSLAIVGSGFIACELANVFDALGVKTKLLVRGNTLLSNEDKEISKTFKEEFSKKY